MAKRTVSATVIDSCTAETRQRHHRIHIENLHKMSTRTADCELFLACEFLYAGFCRSDPAAPQLPVSRTGSCPFQNRYSHGTREQASRFWSN